MFHTFTSHTSLFRPVSLFALLFSLLASAVYAASERNVTVIVSDRSAMTLVSGANQLLQKQPDADIQIRTVSQLNSQSDDELQQLINNSGSLLMVGVFGDPVERLLARQYSTSHLHIQSLNKCIKFSRRLEGPTRQLSRVC